MAWIKIGTKTTDADGKVKFDKLPLGEYRYQQASAKTGYTADTTPHEVAVDSTTPIVESRTNTPIAVGALKITKFSEGYADFKLAGGRFKLMDSAGKTMLTQSAPTAAVTGELTLSNLMTIDGTPQSYKFVEVVAPSGYEINATEAIKQVTVGTTAEEAVANTPTTSGEIEVDLADTNYTEYGLAGSNYDVYVDNGL